jgi:hypothetical protein
MSDVQIPTSNANLIDFRYYAKTSASPIYSAAVALHPEMKFRYFENNWESHPDRVSKIGRALLLLLLLLPSWFSSRHLA